RERTAPPRADHEIRLPSEDDAEGERALDPLQRLPDRRDRADALVEKACEQLDDYLGVRLGLKGASAPTKHGAKLLEVLDDAVVDDRDAFRRVWMGVRHVGSTVGGPARVSDSYVPLDRTGGNALRQIHQLALGAAPFDRGAHERRDPSRIVPAIFQTSEAVDQLPGNRFAADYPDDSAHGLPPTSAVAGSLALG